MAFTTSLTLRALLGRTATQTGFDRLPRVLAGLTPAAKALAVASMARATRGVTLLVVPTDKDVEQLTEDARFFYGALEGASANDTAQAVVPYPSWQVDPYRGMTPHFRVASVRAAALHSAARGTARLVIASAAGLPPLVSVPARIVAASIDIENGTVIEPQRLADILVDGGFTREDPVDEHGTFTIRGGIVDVFPGGDTEPVRIEFVGDQIESIRRFNPSSQRSTGTVDRVAVVSLRERFEGDGAVSVVEFLGVHGLQVVVSESEQVADELRRVRAQLDASHADAAARGQTVVPPPDRLFADTEVLLARLEQGSTLNELTIAGEGVTHIACQPALEFRGRVGDWVADLRQARQRGDTVLFLADSPGRAERVVEILQDYEVVAVPLDRAEDAHVASVLVGVGALSRGFRLPTANLQVYVERDVFEEERRAKDERRSLTKTFLSDLRDLKIGDLVVHVDHGIGEFVGLKQLGVRGASTVGQEFLELRYAGDDKLFVPVERLDLIQKYSGGARPALDRLGGTTWEKAKTRVKKAMRDMAEELLKLYAQRKAVPGYAFGPDTHWQEEFEGAFPYDLTPDQTTAVGEIKKDMEATTPMDRLLCGDVGYGKTEVAMRASFKAVMAGKQVAVLAPTTVLAFQHTKTLRERFAGFPVVIDMVSRFRTRQEISETLAGVTSGKVDVIVGTHRLLSKDVQFKDLGLLVVDEEQRFGVAHKERIKHMRKRVDVLTMTATPIPRTLNMSLVGIRDMSIIETPPKDRLSIQTNVVKFDAAVIEQAIRNELGRGGQVYFVHNRVESIFSMGHLIQRLVPEARVVVGHGQMGDDELERAMLGFVEKRFDVLLATTIVENGLDIPNANTIIINRADRYGLSQLYQLRGRVGRSDRAAYAYLLIPPQDSLSPVAKKRLAAIREFSDLGSGFRVAALDLEIRGAGNLLGGQQSGHIEAIGFEMYTKLLEETIRELKGEDVEDDARATVNLGVDLKIDEGYISDVNQRLTVYRKIAAARQEQELESALDEMRDRYGDPPPSVLNLAEYGMVRILADRFGVESIDREGRFAVMKFRAQAKLDPVHLVRVVRETPGAVLVPPASMKLDLEAATTVAPRVTSERKVPSGSVRARKGDGSMSWWTARARAGTVTAGFTKEDILRRPQNDPRLEGGVFDRIQRVLRALGTP